MLNNFYTSSSILLYDQLEKIPDSRVRLSKIIGRSILGPISMWIAFPSSNRVLPGTVWYDQVWDKYDLSGYKHVDEMISLSTNRRSSLSVSISCHLPRLLRTCC